MLAIHSRLYEYVESMIGIAKEQKDRAKYKPWSKYGLCQKEKKHERISLLRNILSLNFFRKP